MTNLVSIHSRESEEFIGTRLIFEQGYGHLDRLMSFCDITP
jgi:hypothetical protein